MKPARVDEWVDPLTTASASPVLQGGDSEPFEKKMLLTYKFGIKDKHAAELNRQARAVNYVPPEDRRSIRFDDGGGHIRFDMEQVGQGSFGRHILG